jgi:mannose-6-phosphate isomerase-like protein (cupin superfamily)
MAWKQVSPAEMAKRVARMKELKSSSQAFVDTRIPGHEREIFNVIGSGVTEDPTAMPAIADARDFNLTYIGAAPGKGAALHVHTAGVEVFIPITGKWVVYWGDKGEHEVELDQGDVVSVPPDVMRGFRNAGDSYGYLMAILGSTDAGRVDWSPDVLAAARRTGLALDADGNVIEAND